jgi:hypothetical protein
MHVAAVLFGISVAVGVTFEPLLAAQRGGNAPAGPPVSVTVNGREWTQQQLFPAQHRRPDVKRPSSAAQDHRQPVYVGTASLAAFLVVTPLGNILISDA